jgi:DMSO/TMAO reductase YedYZ molybdopterin-dependent catalytic subunit
MGRISIKNRLWTHVPWNQEAFGCSEWTGCSLADILKEAGIKKGAAVVVFTGADKGVEGNQVQYFQRSLTLDDAMLGHCMICYQMNGVDLTPAHGAPVRLIVPGWHGMASVKWLTDIEVRSDDWCGYQMKAYSFRRSEVDPDLVPVTRLPVRALMAPPGHPDFFSRTRFVAPGTHRIIGKAWSGAVELDRVEFSCDGKTWYQAELGPKIGPFAWAEWHFDWDVQEEGSYVLVCRAFDVAGRSQDKEDEDHFNWGSFVDTQPQHVYVRVDEKIKMPGNTIETSVEHRAARSSLNTDDVCGAAMDKADVNALYRAGSQ